MSTEELKTFRKCFSDLNLSIRSDVIPLAEKLFSVGLITSENLNVLSNTNISEVERASKLLSLVLTKITLSARNYHVFVKVLISERDTYKEVLKNLEPIYKEPSEEDEQPATSGSLPAGDKGRDTRLTELAPVCPLEFSDDLSPNRLADWLSQELEKKGLSLTPHMREKLTEDHINGAAFKGLSENDLKAMEFKLGFRKNILAIIAGITKPEDMTKGVDTNKSPKMTCTMSLIPRLVDEPDSSESLCEGGAPASMPFDGRLWRKGKLIVQLKNPDYLSHWKITENDFVGCVCRWCEGNIGGETSYIPKFELGDSNPDILVHFNKNSRNECTIGHNINEYPSKLYLDLSHNDQAYREHLIVHEFGHALGLGHEHQRSDFWKYIKRYLNKDLMKSDVGGRFVDWEVDCNVMDGGASQRYDPDSAMHYWFNKDWLTEGFSNEEKIDEYVDTLLPQVIDALRGVHKRHKCHVTEPSYEDLRFLNEKYKCIRQSGGSSRGGAPAQGTPNGANTEGVHEGGGGPPNPSNGTATENVHQSGGPPPIDKSESAVGQEEATPRLSITTLMLLEGKGKKIEIINKVAPNWKTFGVHLEFDRDGSMLDLIERRNFRDPTDCCRDMFQYWLKGNGVKPLSWSTVTSILRSVGLAVLAKDLEIILHNN